VVGSVDKIGHSDHDLDILLIPVREDYTFEYLYEFWKGDFFGSCYTMADDQGRMIDIFFEE